MLKKGLDNFVMDIDSVAIFGNEYWQILTVFLG